MWKICIHITYRIPLVNLPPNFDPGPGFLYKGDLDSLKVGQLFRNLKVSRVTWSRCLKAISGLPPETVGHLLWWAEYSYGKSLCDIFVLVALLNMSTYRPVGLLDLQHDVKTCFKKRWILDGMFLKTRFLFTTCSCLFVCTVSFGSFFCCNPFQPNASAYSLLPVASTRLCFGTNRHCHCHCLAYSFPKKIQSVASRACD